MWNKSSAHEHLNIYFTDILAISFLQENCINLKSSAHFTKGRALHFVQPNISLCRIKMEIPTKITITFPNITVHEHSEENKILVKIINFGAIYGMYKTCICVCLFSGHHNLNVEQPQYIKYEMQENFFLRFRICRSNEKVVLDPKFSNFLSHAFRNWNLILNFSM